MPKTISPIEYAEHACDTMIRKYIAADLPPKRHFHYHQGVFLSGMYQTYLLDRNEDYFTYIKDWIDSVFDEEGCILEYTHADLDDIQPGILLYPLLDKFGAVRYRKALESVIAQVYDIPVNAEGGFWHKTTLPDQMWLDGLYMSGPFIAEYARRYNRPDLQDLVVRQALLMESKTKDKKTGLLYHAWDGSKKAEWANPDTGLAPHFWGRSIGWVPVAVLDDLEHMTGDTPGYTDLQHLVQNLLHAVCRFQSEDGRWYQVVDKPGEPCNWLENSCSCLFAAALFRSVRRGVLDKSYLHCARKAYEGVIRSLKWSGDDLLIGNVCIGTGVGSYEFYCERPVSVNDLHGVGAFLLMCTEAQQVMDIVE